MSMRKLTLAGIATLVVLSGGAALTSAPALAAPPEGPIAEAPVSITSTAATFNGTVNPHSSATTAYYFTYGEDGVCREEVEEGNGETTGEAVKVSFTRGGLTPSTKYTYCLVAENAVAERTVSNHVEFETLAAKPVVDSESASGLSSTTVTVEAMVNPENQATSCVFRYESAKTSVTTVPCQPGTLEGYGGEYAQNDVRASVPITGLNRGETYSYMVIVENATGKTEGSPQTFTTVSLPKVNDRAPSVSSVTRTTALLSGAVDGERDINTIYHFVYVPAGGYEPGRLEPYRNGASSTSLPVGADSGDVNVGPVPLTGLLAGTTYHYALVATNSAGSTVGPDYTFTTAPPTPPTVATGGVGDMTATSATISGMVDPDGLQTSYEFEIGTDTTYAGGKVFGNAGADSGVETVAVSLGELIPGITYHYRLVATNEDGTAYGADLAFTIPAVPSPIVAGSATPLLATPAIAFPGQGQVSIVSTKSLTRAQKLANTLRVCKKEARKKRALCEKQARKKYEAAGKKKSKK